LAKIEKKKKRMTKYSETWITQTAGDYEKFGLRVMVSLCFSHVATVVNLMALTAVYQFEL